MNQHIYNSYIHLGVDKGIAKQAVQKVRTLERYGTKVYSIITDKDINDYLYKI